MKKRTRIFMSLCAMALLGTGVYIAIDLSDNKTKTEQILPDEENPGEDIGGEEKPLTSNVMFEVGVDDIISRPVANNGILTAEIPTAPAKEGFTFIGWALKGTTETIDFSTYIFTDSVTLVPIYEESVYTVTFSIDGINTSQEVSHGDYVNFAETPTKEGYTFKGYALEGTTEIVDLTTYSITEDTTFVAMFEINVYTVVFSIDGTETIQEVEHGNFSTLPTEPFKTFYTFLGYAIEGTEDIVDVSTYPITADTTFVAIFEEIVAESTSASLFRFDGDTVTGYIGTDSEIVIPKSYSLGEVVTQTKEFVDFMELEEYLMSEGLESLTVIDADENEVEISIFNLPDYQETLAFPVTSSTQVQTYIDGTDYTVSKIGVMAFEDNTIIKKLVIEDNITEINSKAFRGCTSLKSVYLPDSITTISGQAFMNCSSLTEINIPNSVTTLDVYAFSGCRSLMSIDLPDSITSIGQMAFTSCTSLRNFVFPSNVTTISNNMFNGCTALTDITIPANITSIGIAAFQGCTSIIELTIPSAVSSIGHSAFKGCTNLTLTFEADPTGVDITGLDTIKAIYVPSSCYETLINGDWATIADRVHAKEEA